MASIIIFVGSLFLTIRTKMFQFSKPIIHSNSYNWTVPEIGTWRALVRVSDVGISGINECLKALTRNGLVTSGEELKLQERIHELYGMCMPAG